MIGTGEILRLPDAAALADLATYAGRAHRADPDGAARLVARGDVLAVYVSPLHGGGGPVVLGLRTLRLAGPGDLDVTVPLAALGDALSRRPGEPGEPGGLVREVPPAGAGVVTDEPGGLMLEVPPAGAAVVSWAGVSPPRQGWEPVATLDPGPLAAVAASGIAEVVSGAPAGSGAAAVATLRARVWGRPLVDDLPDLPAGAAFAAEVLGFLDQEHPVAVLRCGRWWRLTTPRGHVLTRRPLLRAG